MSLRLLSKGNNASAGRHVEELLDDTYYRLMDPKLAPVIGIVHPKGLFVPFTTSGWSHLFRLNTGLDVGDVVLLDRGMYRITAYTPDYDVEIPRFGTNAVTNDGDTAVLLIPHGGSLMRWKRYPYEQSGLWHCWESEGVHASVFVHEASEQELAKIDRGSVISSLPGSILVPPRSVVEFSENGILVSNEARTSWTLRRKSLWDPKNPQAYPSNLYSSPRSFDIMTGWKPMLPPPKLIDVGFDSDGILQMGKSDFALLLDHYLFCSLDAFQNRMVPGTVWVLLDRKIRDNFPLTPRVLAVDGIMTRSEETTLPKALMLTLALANDLRRLEVF